MRIDQLYHHFLTSTGVCTDTRNLIEGSLFFALKGANFNGNHFTNQAIEAGCVLALADETPTTPDPRIIVVDNALEVMQQLAAYHRQQLNIPVIGLTGSNGKTTTKELIHAVLQKKYNVHATKGNLNNHIGVPLTLLAMSKETEIAVIEMGANQPDDIKQLCEIADPDYGIITNIGEAHLQGFGSKEGVSRAKGQLFDHIRKRKGTAICNASDALIQELSHGIRKFTYSVDDSRADVQSKLISESVYVGLKWKTNNYSSPPVQTLLVGGYNLPNLLAAIATGIHFNVDYADISAALAEYEPKNNRSQLLKTEKNHILLDAYNANPSSVHAALEDFAQYDHGNRFVIFGDMFELGTRSLSAHQKVLEKLMEHRLRGMVIGKAFLQASVEMTLAEIKVFETTKEAETHLQKQPITDRFILLKGSRGMQLEKLTKLL